MSVGTDDLASQIAQDLENAQTDTQEPEAPPEPAEPDDSGQPDDGGGTDDAGGEPGDPLIQHMLETYPEKAAIIGKYRSGSEALRGLLDAASKVGERDEDAIFARRLKALYEGREDELHAILSGQHRQPADKPSDDEPLSYAEARRLQAEIKLEGERADPAKVHKLQEAQERNARFLFELAQNPAAALQPFLQPLLDPIGQQWQAQQQQLAADQQGRLFADFGRQNASWIFQGGQQPPPGTQPKYTPLGMQFIHTMLDMQQDPELGRLSPPRMLEIAKARLMAARQSTPARTKTQPSALHTPNTRAPTASRDEMLKGLSPEEALLKELLMDNDVPIGD